MIVNETDTYTNTTGQEQLIGVTNFSFYAGSALSVSRNGNHNWNNIHSG